MTADDRQPAPYDEEMQAKNTALGDVKSNLKDLKTLQVDRSTHYPLF